ncbi:MAG: alkaline phosphatase [Candidatus Hodarchaeota archaeon]
MKHRSPKYSKFRFELILLIIPLFIISSGFPERVCILEISSTYGSYSDTPGMSVILMIGDGMGPEQVKLARWTEVGEDGQLNMENLPYQANVTTNSLNNPITDSAAAATAIATGQKTNNGILSLTPAGQSLETILEYASTLKKNVGLVSTTEVTHATPAAFYAHVKSRYNYSEIARQLVDDADIDVIMGGGKDMFTSSQISTLETKGYTLIWNRSQMADIDKGKILGLFASGPMPYDKDRNRDIVPSLSEMTSKTLDILSQDPDGFVLVVEGGQIDWACHANNIENAALETIEFDKAVEVAKNFVVQNENILLIVTADHETGGLTVNSNTLNETLPSSQYTAEQGEQLRIARVQNISVHWSGTSHTNRNVPFYGLGANLISYNQTILDNTEIYEICIEYLNQVSSSQRTSGFLFLPIVTSYIIWFILRKIKK